MNKTLATGDVELLYWVCGLVAGPAQRQTAQEVMRSSFDTGQKISYAFGRNQDYLEKPFERLQKMRQEKAKELKALRDAQTEDPGKKAEADAFEKEWNAELNEVLEDTEEVRLYGWKFSKLRERCRTIPATWLSLLEHARLPEEDLTFLNKKKVKASRRDLEAVALALKEVGKPTEDNRAAAYEVGNKTSLAMGLTMFNLHKLLLEITDKVKETRKQANALRGLDDEQMEPAEEVPAAEGATATEGDPPVEPEAEAGAETGPAAQAPADAAPEAAADEPVEEDPEVTEKLKALEEALDAWRDEKIEAEVYLIDIEKIPDDCATIPSNVWQALEPILEEAAA